MNDSTIQHVSDTALWVAIYRAEESKRPDSLFKDPYAARLAGERGVRIAASTKANRYTGWSLSIRTWVIDGYIQELVAQGNVDCLLNLGAGLDTRPYRMEGLPRNFKWIEADFPHMIALKNEKLVAENPRCDLKRIAVDLSDDVERSKVLAEVANEGKKILVLTEGVVPYLNEQQVQKLARDLRSHTNFRYWIVEYFSKEAQRHLRKRNSKELKNSPFQFFPEKWFDFFLAAGWKPKETRYLGEAGHKLGRPFPIPMWIRPLAFLIGLSPKRRQEFFQMMGYSLLEPS